MLKKMEETDNKNESLLPVIRAAFVASLPVLMGYVTMGIAFGVLLVRQVEGANPWWAFGMSTSTVSGSMQFAAVEMLKNAPSYSLLLTAALAVLINIRYAMYGLNFIQQFRSYPWYLRFILIVGLTDESFAIVSACKYEGRQKKCYFTCVECFDWSYWVIGGVIGAAIGNMLPFNTDGIEFAMLALFAVILVDLCKERANWFPAIVGGVVTAITMAIAMLVTPANANKMLLPAMAAIIVVLLAKRPKAVVKEGEQNA